MIKGQPCNSDNMGQGYRQQLHSLKLQLRRKEQLKRL